MCKKYIIISLVVIFSSLIVLVGCDSEYGSISYAIQSRDNDASDAGEVTSDKNFQRGTLLNGAIYEFRGEFDFMEFRDNLNLIYETPVRGIVSAGTPTEAAEEGQRIIFSTSHGNRQSTIHMSIFVVQYCPITDNWVIWVEFLREYSYRLRGRHDIVAINRTTGVTIKL